MKTTTDPTPSPPLVPDTLTVVLIDDTPNYIAIVHENGGGRTPGAPSRSG